MCAKALPRKNQQRRGKKKKPPSVKTELRKYQILLVGSEENEVEYS